MKKSIIITLGISILCLNLQSQTLTGSYLNINTTDTHLGQFLYNENSNRPRIDIWGSASKINFRTTYGNGPGAALSFGTASVADALLINENGTINLTSTLTLKKLFVSSTESQLAQFYWDDNAAGQTRPRLDILGSASKISLRTGYNLGPGASLALGTNSVNDALIIKENGYVGIGTSTPQYLLEVKKATSGNIAFFQDGTKGIIFQTLTSGSSIIGSNGSAFNDIEIRATSGSGTGLYLSTTGNIGIGTTLATNTENFKLAVKGKIGCSELKVLDVTNWSDFVFATGYKLRTLSEVEHYIKQNQHLPDVPSEKEVKAEGYDLTDMNALLLQKIEELTLYVIELKKENEEQQIEIEKLKKKVLNKRDMCN
jgi:hypothetical protein